MSMQASTISKCQNYEHIIRVMTLVFADSEKDQPNVSVSDIMKKVTDKTKAIVVVHYAGVPVDVHSI